MFKHTLSLLLFALVVGFIAGCGSSNPLADEAKSNIESQNFQAALTAAEESISERPQDPLGYYYKAVALSNIADEQPPDQRQEYYDRMNDAFEEAREVANSMEGDPPGELENIEVVKDAIWRTEHRRAYLLATDDSLQQAEPNHMQMAISHLENATYVRPDSMISWNLMAQIHGIEQEFSQAAELKGKVMDSRFFDPDTSDYLQHARYLLLDEQPEEAIAVLEDALERYPQSTDVTAVLADAYMENDQSDQAIATVRKLIDRDPENPQYRLSLGTQIYRSALVFSDSLDNNVEEIYDLQDQVRTGEMTAQEANPRIEELLDQNEELRSNMNELTEEAIDHLERVLEQRPEDFQALNTLGIIYQNWAASVQDQRNLTTDNERANELTELSQEYLTNAMNYYEKATEIQPDNIELWQGLYTVYVNLGMDEKAKEAAEKAGMN